MEASIINSQLLKDRDAQLKPNRAKLCKKLGIARTTYYDLINGRTGASKENLERIANELGLNLADVVTL